MPQTKTEMKKKFKKIWKCEHPECGGGGICQRDRILNIFLELRDQELSEMLKWVREQKKDANRLKER